MQILNYNFRAKLVKEERLGSKRLFGINLSYIQQPLQVAGRKANILYIQFTYFSWIPL